MTQSIATVSLIVRDYDEALAYYTGALGFRLLEDRPQPTAAQPDKRWVVVAPPGAESAGTARLLLAKAKNAAELAAVGNQTGDRVFLFLETDDFHRDHRAFTARGVEFLEAPREQDYGTVAVFRDLYGNKWDLLQPK